MATLRPGQSLEPFLTEDDHAAMLAEMEAAARGDARSAWEHHMSGLILEESLHRHRLRQIVDLGDDAPGWVYSRWCVDQAYRWMLVTEDPRTDDMVRVVLAATHLDHVEGLFEDETAFTEYGTLVAATDWLAEQLCVYTAGGLRDFLDLRAEPSLLARADRVEEWADAPLGVFELQERRDAVLVLRDLVHDRVVEVLNIGGFDDQPTDTVLGRVVPTSAPPYRMFDLRPVPLDRRTAYDVAEAMQEGGGLAWLDAVSLAREEGRLDRGFSCRGQTLIATDLVLEPLPDRPDGSETPGRLRELMDDGLDEYVANGVMVAEVALIAATVADAAPATLTAHLGSVLIDSRIFAAALRHCSSPEWEEAWRRLAAAATSPVRERCLEIADRCRRNAA